MTSISVTHTPIDHLNANPANARTHSRSQIKKLARSIREFGLNSPILIDKDGVVLAGHGRLEAARSIGMETVPVICLDHLTPQQARAFMIADNRIAELAGWDMEVLASELDELINLDVEVSLTGFDIGEIDVMLEKAEASAHDELDLVPTPPDNRGIVTRPGDVWNLGPHRIICGNAQQGEDLEVLLGGDPVHMVFADPPYNVPVRGHVSGLGETSHREFPEASGEMSSHEFTRFLAGSINNAVRHCVDGAILHICMDWRHMGELLAARSQVGLDLINLCVWKKTNAGMGSLYRSQHELVFVLKHGKGAHINNVELGKHGRHRSNVWAYAGANTFRKGRTEDLAAHPTVKPVALVADCIRDVSNPGHVVLDPFLGSGTTLLAAELTGRMARGVELDPAYVDVAIDRWQRMTGHQAILASTNESFSIIRSSRCKEAAND